MKTKTEKITLSGMLLALGLVLPFALAHGFGISGTVLLPMHIPVLLAGILCGPLYGAALGLLLPLFNCLFTGMPTLYPMVPIMTAELFTYGLFCGLLLAKTPLGRRRYGVYIALPVALLLGRVAYGLAFRVLFFLDGDLKALSVLAATLTGLPGILIQLVLVPLLTYAAEAFFRRERAGLIKSLISDIREDKLACAVIKEGKVIARETGRGILPLLSLYRKGALKDAVIIDKIVGRAAALLLLAGGARACHAAVASDGAIALLSRHGFRFTYEERTSHIVNRKGTGICPMEEATAAVANPKEAPAALEARLAALRTAHADTALQKEKDTSYES